MTAGRIVEACVRDRAAFVRRKGFYDVAVGLGLALGAITVGLGIMMVYPLAQQGGKVFGAILGICILAGLYGLIRLTTGVERIVAGARMKGAASAIDDDLI